MSMNPLFVQDDQLDVASASRRLEASNFLDDRPMVQDSSLVMAPHLAAAAHDLGSLVSNFKMRLYLTQRTPNRLAEHLKALDNLVVHLEGLVQEFIDVSRPASSLRETGVLNLNEVVEHIVQAYEPVAYQKGIRLTFESDPDLWPIWAADLDIKRIVINLLCNALNFTPAEGSVTLTTRQVGASVELSVSDTGIGISPEALPHIFERFYRSTEAECASPGVGLGLPIALSLIEKYAGVIEVESTPGKGSHFTVILPGLS